MRQYLLPMRIPVVTNTVLDEQKEVEPCYLTLDFKRETVPNAKIVQITIDESTLNPRSTIQNNSMRKPIKSVQCPRNMMYQSFHATHKAHR